VFSVNLVFAFVPTFQHRGVDGATIVVLVHIKILIDSLLLFIQLLIDLVLSSEMSDVGQHNDASIAGSFGRSVAAGRWAPAQSPRRLLSAQAAEAAMPLQLKNSGYATVYHMKMQQSCCRNDEHDSTTSTRNL
jgi:hypothetical protein